MDRTNRAIARARSAFTLVELLVVIIIIAILAGLAVPAVMRAASSAQNARIKTEIDMLHQAIMQYRNEYQSFPPCVDMPAGAILKHVQRIFPRMPASNFNAAGAAEIQPNTSLYKWLSGYASDDPTNPLNPNGKPKKMFDFDAARIAANQFAPPSKPLSPYIYIDSAHYGLYDAASGSPFGGIYYSHRVPSSAAPTNFALPTQPYANPDTFQILCAGRDEKFGTDDDMSNFWPGTRKEFIDAQR